LGRYPQIKAFIEKRNEWFGDNLRVSYQRGSDPIIRLKDASDNVIEELGIERWDTNTVMEFLKEKLQ
jgi:hypothetical protein